MGRSAPKESEEGSFRLDLVADGSEIVVFKRHPSYCQTVSLDFIHLERISKPGATGTV
jgi:hypothetical protein